MSILVVGIGPTSLTSMDQLEENTRKLSQNSRNTARDIVQYVAFQEYLDKYDIAGSFHLVKHLLADVPEQLVAYMQMKGIVPKNKEILSNLN